MPEQLLYPNTRNNTKHIYTEAEARGVGRLRGVVVVVAVVAVGLWAVVLPRSVGVPIGRFATCC